MLKSVVQIHLPPPFQPLDRYHDLLQTMTKHPLKASFIFSLFAIVLIATEAINTPAKGIFLINSSAQTMRNFPEAALRGTIAFKAPPEIVLDGKPERLSPGARIKNEHNLLVLTAALAGKSLWWITNAKTLAVWSVKCGFWALKRPKLNAKTQPNENCTAYRPDSL